MTGPAIDCEAVCALGHRGFAHIYGYVPDELVAGVCATCGGPTRLSPLPPAGTFVVPETGTYAYGSTSGFRRIEPWLVVEAPRATPARVEWDTEDLP